MRGCLTFIITALILFGCGGTALVMIIVFVPLLLGDENVSDISGFHWYTWVTWILLPLILLKLLVKISRFTANYICDALGVE
jgi:hypothetical protein